MVRELTVLSLLLAAPLAARGATPPAAAPGKRVVAAPKAPAHRTAAPPKARRPAAPKRLPFVEDDYRTALADARARNVPLVVDVWAPW